MRRAASAGAPAARLIVVDDRAEALPVAEVRVRARVRQVHDERLVALAHLVAEDRDRDRLDVRPDREGQDPARSLEVGRRARGAGGRRVVDGDRRERIPGERDDEGEGGRTALALLALDVGDLDLALEASLVQVVLVAAS